MSRHIMHCDAHHHHHCAPPALPPRQSVAQIAAHRKREYDKFLKASAKRDLFTEIVTKDYDPFSLVRATAYVKQPFLHDPMKRCLDKPLEEDRLNEKFNVLKARQQAMADEETLRLNPVAAAEAGLTAESVAQALAATARTGPGAGQRPSSGATTSGSRRLSRVSTAPPGSIRTGPPSSSSGFQRKAVQDELDDIPGPPVKRTDPVVERAKSGKGGGRVTLKTTMWGKGKLESTMGGLKKVDDSEAHTAKSMRVFRRGRDNLMGDYYTEHSLRATQRRVARELPKPTKRAFKQGGFSFQMNAILQPDMFPPPPGNA